MSPARPCSPATDGSLRRNLPRPQTRGECGSANVSRENFVRHHTKGALGRYRRQVALYASIVAQATAKPVTVVLLQL